MNKEHTRDEPNSARHPEWMRRIKIFETAHPRKAWAQISNTVIPFLGLYLLMLASVALDWPYLVTIAMMPLAALLLMRIFIFFHDCTHSSFFKTRRANSVWGTIFGILTYTAYDDWRRAHGMHHNSAGNLDRRGVGDVWTMTMQEYRDSSRARRFLYRVYRNPVMLFLIIPPVLFFVLQRIPKRVAGPKERRSVLVTNLGIAAIFAAIALTCGVKAMLLVPFPMFYLASVIGVWLFYVQHQFDPGYWERESEWNPIEASLQGSSHYKLPKILQWFSGNIGLHHIHHARPRIPNYNLQACYDATPELQLPSPLTFGASLRAIGKQVWDEGNKRLLSFRQARKLLRGK